MSALDTLMLLMPPPAEVTAPATWEEAEAEFGLQFSDDHKAFVTTYGQGIVGPELTIRDPRRFASFRVELETSTLGLHDSPGSGISEDGLAPFVGFPSSGPSLLPIGSNGNADALFQVVTNGVCGDDPLWLGNARGRTWQKVPGPLTAFLVARLTGDGRGSLGAFDEALWHLAPTFSKWPAR